MSIYGLFSLWVVKCMRRDLEKLVNRLKGKKVIVCEFCDKNRVIVNEDDEFGWCGCLIESIDRDDIV